MHATTADDLLVVDALYDSLTTWHRRLEARPSVALRWTPRRDGRTWRFHLRRTASFHDGTPVTARHFVRTWNAAVREGGAHHHLRDVLGYDDARAGRGRLRGVVAVDAATLDVSLSRPVPDFPVIVGHPALGPMRRASRPRLEQPIGNGPFHMAEPWVRGRFVRLQRDGVADPQEPIGVPVDEIVFVFQDETTAYLAYEQSRVDVSPLPVGAPRGREPPGPRVTRYRGPGLLEGVLPTTYFLWFNTRSAPFDRVAVRRAVSHAIDRERLAREVFDGGASPATSLVPPVVPGGRNATCDACRYRPTAARQALQRLSDDQFTLWVNRGGDHERVAERVQVDLARVGVTIRVRVVGFKRFLRAVRRGDATLFRFGWTMDYPVLENGVRPLFHSASAPPDGANLGRYGSQRVDVLLERAAAASDETRRTALLHAAEDVALGRHQAIIPLVRLHRRTIVADRVLGLRYGPFGTVDFTAVRLVRRVQ